MSKSPVAFIGFSEKYAQVVRAAYKIADSLRTRGIGTYIAREDRQYGRSITAKVHAAIDKSVAAVFVWTRSAYESLRVNEELEYSMNQGKPIILLRYLNTPLHRLWAETDWEYQKLDGVRFAGGLFGTAIGPIYDLPRFNKMVDNVAAFVQSVAAPSGQP